MGDLNLDNQDVGKRLAAVAAAERVADGMLVGLGTGSTVAYLLTALADRGVHARFVCTSPRTEAVATDLGLEVQSFDQVTRLDLAIDGADEVDPDFWLIKGGGAAHTREKLVAAAADAFIVIVDSSKVVDALRGPVPLELLGFGLASTMARLGPIRLREVALSPDGGVIADYVGPIEDPATLAASLASTPGVIEHGLFPPTLVTEVVVGGYDGVRWLPRRST
ncbi:MAG: ribose-5-phosphate isomerase RpiA, partial [Actinomycetales bacterium]